MREKRLFILEDDPIVASDLEATLLDLNYTVCGVSHQPFDAKKKIEQLLPDLILLDINLNSDIDGIDLATLIQNLGIGFIFISAFTDKKTIDRVKALNPLGYIIKPFSEKDIEITLELAFLKKSTEGKSENSPNETHIYVKTKNNLSVKINFDAILYIEAYDNYSFIYTLTEKLIVSYTLKELEQKIKCPHLIRVHRSFIINNQKVEALQYNNLIINKHEIPIGKSYKDAVVKLFPTL